MMNNQQLYSDCKSEQQKRYKAGNRVDITMRRVQDHARRMQDKV